MFAPRAKLSIMVGVLAGLQALLSQLERGEEVGEFSSRFASACSKAVAYILPLFFCIKATDHSNMHFHFLLKIGIIY